MCVSCSHCSVVTVSGTRDKWLHCHSDSHCVVQAVGNQWAVTTRIANQKYCCILASIQMSAVHGWSMRKFILFKIQTWTEQCIQTKALPGGNEPTHAELPTLIWSCRKLPEINSWNWLIWAHKFWQPPLSRETFYLYFTCNFANLHQSPDWWRETPWFSLISGCRWLVAPAYGYAKTCPYN